LFSSRRVCLWQGEELFTCGEGNGEWKIVNGREMAFGNVECLILNVE